MQRINKIIAEAGIASRRKADELIRQGRVEVNGKTAAIGQQASEKDKITVDGKLIETEQKAYYALYKPKGYVTTTQEQHGMKTIMDILGTKERLFPTGRLDKDAEGLIIMTNDGEWANKIMHPKYEITKEYEATLDKPFKGTLKNITIENRKVQIENPTINGKQVKLTIHEGRKHIVKKIFEQQGYKVKRLIRTRIGPIKLGQLKKGQKRKLSEEEVRRVVQNS